MPDDNNDNEATDALEFEPDVLGGGAASGDLTAKEIALFGRDQKENAVVIPLWRGGYISFNPRESVSIFALLALVLLLVIVVAVSFIGIWIPLSEWMQTIMTALGHAITGVVGAIVGSAASKSK